MTFLFLTIGLPWLLKSTLISGLLYAWYRWFLRNAPFHDYNRWFLLASIIVSVVAPLIPLPFSVGWDHPVDNTVQLLTVTGNSNGIAPANRPALPAASAGLFDTVPTLLAAAYWIGVLLFLSRIGWSLFLLFRLTRRSALIKKEQYWLYATDSPAAPFSFFRLLFWNNTILMDSEKGQAILRHEEGHIRQKHSLDILLTGLIRCISWCNPFSHLLIRELQIVHEFQADRYSLSFYKDRPAAGYIDARAQYAEWLVWQSVENRHPLQLVHSFYHTHLKRRITMITMSPIKKGLSTRLLALPVFLLICCAFARETVSAPPPALSIIRTTDDDQLMRFYIHHLRYPGNALKIAAEQTIFFSVQIGNNNQLLEFRQLDALTDLSNKKVLNISVKARMPNTPPGNTEKTAPDATSWFADEARRASEQLPADTMKAYPPGEYFFSIKFFLERPFNKQSADRSTTAPDFWWKQFLPAPPPGQGC